MTTKMVPKPITINEIAAKFTVENIPKIEGDPNYESINEMMQLLYANSAHPERISAERN